MRRPGEFKPRPWTGEEIQFLRDHVATSSFRAIAAKLKRSYRAVNSFAKQHGMRRGTQEPWTQQEIQTLRDHAQELAPRLARLLGRPVHQIHAARKRFGLAKRMLPKGDRFDSFLTEKHALGWSDNEIAIAYAATFPGHRGLDRHFIASRRIAKGLGSNAHSEHQRRRTAAKTAEQIAAAGLRSIGDLRTVAFNKRKREMGWPEDLQMQEANILTALWERGPMTRIEIAKAIGRRTEYPGPYGDKRILGGNGPGGSLLATLLRRGMIVRYQKAAAYAGRSKRRKVDLYSLSLNIQRGQTG